MRNDALDEIPSESREYLTAEIIRILEVDAGVAENLIRASEPFWTAMEEAGGLVDAWGGGEFTAMLPLVLQYIQKGTPAV